ncbi:MAG: hypothetical protein JWR80_6728, partial [Bradyrhizobium sp.]|nr:hypothetical protein [Bradyrhizobium sp.]
DAAVRAAAARVTDGERLQRVVRRQRVAGLVHGALKAAKAEVPAPAGPAIPVWPFDPLPDHGALVVEIYTAIAARAAGLRKGLSKLRDATALDAALAVIGSRPHAPLARYTDHATDVILTAAWLRANAHRPELWHPPGLTRDIALSEGWTFGVT